MPTYVVLINWTDQGVKGFKDTVDRWEQARDAGNESGLQWGDTYWTVGPYDIVSTLEGPDDETVMAGLLRVASLGNIRTTTMRAFSPDEMRSVIQKAG
jgi:uncharacterized protein with GYD domain